MREKVDRNADIVARYLAGETLAQIRQRHGISMGAICRIVKRLGVMRTPEERYARLSEMAARIARDPDVQARKAVKMREHYRMGRVGPRRTIFEHDPVKREEYLMLRDAMGAAYARSVMGLDAA